MYYTIFFDTLDTQCSSVTKEVTGGPWDLLCVLRMQCGQVDLAETYENGNENEHGNENENENVVKWYFVR